MKELGTHGLLACTIPPDEAAESRVETQHPVAICAEEQRKIKSPEKRPKALYSSTNELPTILISCTHHLGGPGPKQECGPHDPLKASHSSKMH